VHHALENSIRRRMLISMVEGQLTIQSMAQVAGDELLDYHLHRLEMAGLIRVREGCIILTESGQSYGSLVKAQAEKGGTGRL